MILGDAVRSQVARAPITLSRRHFNKGGGVLQKSSAPQAKWEGTHFSGYRVLLTGRTFRKETTSLGTSHFQLARPDPAQGPNPQFVRCRS